MALSLATCSMTFSGTSPSYKVIIDGCQPLHSLPSRFVSFTMDAGAVAHWWKMKSDFWQNELAIGLAKHLAPAVFRFGGTSEDYTLYDFSQSSASAQCELPLPSPTHGCTKLNATQFDTIAGFARTVGWDFVYGANVGTERDPDSNHWVSDGLASLLQHAAKVANVTFYGLELGNEPDLMCVGPAGERYSCGHPPDGQDWKYEHAISPAQLASDYAAFRELAQRAGAKVVGPDVADKLTDYAQPFLSNLSAPLDAFTWHFYYGPGSSRPHGLNASQFSSVPTLDKFLNDAKTARQVADQSAEGAELWLGETSSTYGGGTANASASFVAGFLWVDKLGIAAATGHQLVARQTFSQSDYAILGRDNLPNPDFWSTLLWKRLVGGAVLRTDDLLASGRAVRVYAFCAAAGAGAVTLVVLNTEDEEAQLTLEGVGGAGGAAEVYWLTSTPGLLTSRDAYLNGELLRLADETTGALPPLTPRRVTTGPPLSLAPKSYGFVVLPEAGAAACGASPMVEDA